jgi:LysM repeat protein
LISDSIEGRKGVMKKRDIMDTLDVDLEVDFSDDEGYSIRRKKRGNRSAGKPSGKSGLSFLVGVVIFGLVVLVAVVFYRFSTIDSENELESLERRITKLEERLYRLDWIETNLEEIKKQNEQLRSLKDTLKKPTAPPKSTTAQKPITPPESTTAQPAEEQIDAVYHEVAPGETLYRIGLRYGIAVDELLRLNDLEPGATIYPKQKLIISPAGTR